MAKDRSLVRASDIGTWTFCRRAWWLAHVQQAEHENPAVLQRGVRAHVAHGRRVVSARRLQQMGLILVSVGLVSLGLLLLIGLGLGKIG